jgi:predicted GNAT family acetyltransferase
MNVQQFNTETKGAFKAFENEVQAGMMTYSWAGPQRIIVDHTEVEPAFNGKGVGKMMLQAVVDFARKEHVKVLPLCPFAKSVFDKDPSIGDVL